MYTFTELTNYNLNNYNPHIGWIGDEPIKIYSKDGSDNYFLHDEQADRLFEFSTDGVKLKSREEADIVVSEFLKAR